MKKCIGILIVLILQISCSEDAATDNQLACSCIGPDVIALEVLQNGSNVFEDEIYALNEVFISEENPRDFVISLQEWDFSLDGSDLRSILIVDHRDWEERDYTFSLNISEDFIFPVGLEIIRSEGECCGGIALFENFEFNGVVQGSGTDVITLNLDR